MLHDYDLGWAELIDCLVQRLEAEVGFQRVRVATDQHLPGIPVHGGDQIEEATAHRDLGDVSTPDLIGPFHAQPTQQVRVGLMPLRGSAPSHTCKYVLAGNGYQASGRSASSA